MLVAAPALHGLPPSQSQENTLFFGNQDRVPYGANSVQQAFKKSAQVPTEAGAVRRSAARQSTATERHQKGG